MTLYKPGSPTGAEERHIKSTPLSGTHSIDDFNAKVKVAVLPANSRLVSASN